MKFSSAAISVMRAASTSCLTLSLLSTCVLEYVISATDQAQTNGQRSTDTLPSQIEACHSSDASGRHIEQETSRAFAVYQPKPIRTGFLNCQMDQWALTARQPQDPSGTHNTHKAYHGSPTIQLQEIGELLPASGIQALLSDGTGDAAVDAEISQKDRRWLESINAQLNPKKPAADRKNNSQENSGQGKSVRESETSAAELGETKGSAPEATPGSHARDLSAAKDQPIGDTLVMNESDPGRPLTKRPQSVEPSTQPELVEKTQLASTKTKETIEIVGWPLPGQLVTDLEKIKDNPLILDWAKAALDTYQSLNAIELTNPESISLIEYTRTLAETLDNHTPQLADPTDPGLEITLGKITSAMRRRADIWAQAHKLSQDKIAGQTTARSQPITSLIAARSRNIELENIDPLWVEYLMLKKANEIFSEPKPNPLKQQVISRKILARLTSSQLDSEQMKFAQRLIGNDLGWALREAASGAPDLGQLLIDIEKFEAKPSSGSTSRLTSHYQNLYWSEDPETNELAALLNDHYRRSNIQLELSETLMNRLIPQSTTNQEPVTDRIMGAQVRGQMQITNRIEVDLIPDDDHLNFNLQYDGRVLSLTRAHARGFTFNNLGNGLVNASKIIAVGEDGISTAPTIMKATSRDRVEGIRGPFDDVPFFGGFSKRLAQQQHQSKRPQTKQIVEGKMRKEFRNRIDSELENQIGKANQLFQDIILSPLHTMELEPKVMKLKTTSEAVQVSYRLASLEQIGSSLPRPKTGTDSLACFQLHRTAINNVINRIQISGKRFTPQEFMDHMGSLLGREDLHIPEEQDRDDVTFEFANRDPVMLDFEDGYLFINLRIKRLQVGKNSRWKNLTITTRYKPNPMGQRLYLKFDDDFGLRVAGRLRLADQIAVRTVFSALFKPNFQFDILPPRMANHPATQGMGISELQLSEGWLTVSMNQLPAYGKISDQEIEFPGGLNSRPNTPLEDEGNSGTTDAKDGILERISQRYRSRQPFGNWK